MLKISVDLFKKMCIYKDQKRTEEDLTKAYILACMVHQENMPNMLSIELICCHYWVN
jgi:hypothetical protein